MGTHTLTQMDFSATTTWFVVFVGKEPCTPLTCGLDAVGGARIGRDKISHPASLINYIIAYLQILSSPKIH
jgi:hypothetical protein